MLNLTITRCVHLSMMLKSGAKLRLFIGMAKCCGCFFHISITQCSPARKLPRADLRLAAFGSVSSCGTAVRGVFAAFSAFRFLFYLLTA